MTTETNPILMACLNRLADQDCEKPVAFTRRQLGVFWCPYNWKDHTIAWCLPCLARKERDRVSQEKANPSSDYREDDDGAPYPPCIGCGLMRNLPGESGRWRAWIDCGRSRFYGKPQVSALLNFEPDGYQHEHQDQWVDCEGLPASTKAKEG